MNTALVILLFGYLSYGPVLPRVAEYRMDHPTAYPIESVDSNIECLLGVPYNLKHLIGQRAYFLSTDNVLYGPMLIVDTEQKKHRGQLQKANLAADIYCFDDPEKLVHKAGWIIMDIEFY